MDDRISPNAGDCADSLKLVQELLQEREANLKLQEVNRQKIVFLASATHELKTSGTF